MKTKEIKMKWIVTCLMLFFLSSCQPGWSDKWTNYFSSDTTQTDQKSSSQATIYLSDNQTMDLTAFNKMSGSIDLKNSGIWIPLDSNSDFSLSFNNNENEINDDNKKKIKIQVTSTCTIKNESSSEEKIKKELEIKKSNLNISFLEVMPDQALIQQRPISCRFEFKVLDNDQATRTYIVFSKSIAIDSKELNLRPLRQELGDKYYPISQDGLINETNFNNIELNLDGDFKDNLWLACEDLDSNILLKKTNSTKIFESLYPEYYKSNQATLENMQGIKNCRIISKSQSLITGLSSSFQMDFNSIKTILYKKYINLESLKYELMPHEDSKTSFQPMSRSYKSKYEASKPKNIKPVLDEGSFIKINGLPRNFHENKYEDVTMIIESICSLHKDSLEDLKAQIYEFPLQDKISVMSIVPEKFFQLYYKIESTMRIESLSHTQGCSAKSYDLKRGILDQHINIDRYSGDAFIDAEGKYRVKTDPCPIRGGNYAGTYSLDGIPPNQAVHCNYKIDFKKSDEIKRATGTKSFEIEIKGGSSYGIKLNEVDVEYQGLDYITNSNRSREKFKDWEKKRGLYFGNPNIKYHVTKEDIKSKRAGYLSFLFKEQFFSYHDYQRNMKPDTIALKCGRQKNTEASELFVEEKFSNYSDSPYLDVYRLFDNLEDNSIKKNENVSAEEYFKNSEEQARCRVMFYKNDNKNNKKNLLYFSSEILIGDKINFAE